MKRLISLIMSAVLICLAFSSCGKGDTDSSAADSGKPSDTVQTTAYAVDFEDVKDGMIKHYNHGRSVITEADGCKSTDDFYIYLPKGSVISGDKEFAVFCYDFSFVLKTDIMVNSGITMDKLAPVFKTGKVTLSEECYVRISVKGELSDITVAVPENSLSTVLSGSKKQLMNQPVIRTVTEDLSSRQSAVNYLFLTDLHYGNDPTAKTNMLITEQVEAAVQIANTVDSVDFIVIGGDTTTGMYETKADAIKYTTMALEPLKECKKPVFVLMGNHDDNSYHRFTYDVYYPDRVISDKDWNDNIIQVFCPEDIVQDKEYENSKYYYYDLSGKKTRIICLDALDYRAKYDKNGVIAELPIKDASATAHVSKYWSGCSWWGYSEDQMQWLAEEALTAPDDWDYIFLSHMGIDKDTNSYGYSTLQGKTLRSIIEAYQNKTACSGDGFSADFTGRTGKILSYQFGHIHTELTNYSKDIDLWQICTATANPSQSSSKPLSETSITNKELDWNILVRTGEDNEKCFDIMSVDESKILKYAFGAGSDEEMTY